MTQIVEWIHGSKAVTRNRKSQELHIDWDDGPSPVEMLIQSAGACSLADVVIGLKDRVFSKAWVEIEAERYDGTPRYVTSLHFHFYVQGEVPIKLLERLVEKAFEKYCSVTHSLRKDMHLTWESSVIN